MSIKMELVLLILSPLTFGVHRNFPLYDSTDKCYIKSPKPSTRLIYVPVSKRLILSFCVQQPGNLLFFILGQRSSALCPMEVVV